MDTEEGVPENKGKFWQKKSRMMNSKMATIREEANDDSPGITENGEDGTFD